MPSTTSAGSMTWAVRHGDGYEPILDHIERELGEIGCKRADVAKEARAMFDAAVADFQKDRGPSVSKEEAAYQQSTLIDDLQEAVVGGKMTGHTIALLRAYSESTFFGAEVREHASTIRELLAREIAAVTLPLKPGALRLPFEMRIDGEKVEAHFIGLVAQRDGFTFVREPRAEVNGKKVLLSDAALCELLDRHGHTADMEGSGQTRYFETHLGLHARAVHFDGTEFRMLTAKDINGGRWQYYHDDLVEVR